MKIYKWNEKMVFEVVFDSIFVIYVIPIWVYSYTIYFVRLFFGVRCSCCIKSRLLFENI